MAIEAQHTNGYLEPFDEDTSDDAHRLRLLEITTHWPKEGPVRRKLLKDFNLTEDNLRAWSDPHVLNDLRQSAARTLPGNLPDTSSEEVRSIPIAFQERGQTNILLRSVFGVITHTEQRTGMQDKEVDDAQNGIPNFVSTGNEFLKLETVTESPEQPESTSVDPSHSDAPLEVLSKAIAEELVVNQPELSRPNRSTVIWEGKESRRKIPYWLVPELPARKENAPLEKEERETAANAILEKVDLIIEGDSAMEKVWLDVQQASKSDGNILLRGETGTGKELLFHAIRLLHNPHGDFCMVNCPGINPSLIESELFGHRKGAFTNAIEHRTDGAFQVVANRGTLFLDEIGDLPMEQQATLLRVLESRQFSSVGTTKTSDLKDTKIVAATHQNLEELVLKGRFRKDLLYRLAGHTITIPSLTERELEHREALIGHFIRQLQKKRGRDIRMTQETLDVFLGGTYPGNVRELRGHVIRAYDEAAWGHEDIVGITPEHVTSTRKNEGRPERQRLNSSSRMSEFLDGAIRIDTCNDFQLKELDVAINLDKLDGRELILNRVIDIIVCRVIQVMLLKHQFNQSVTAELLDITRGKIRDRLPKARDMFGDIDPRNFTDE